ncbi:MAG: C-type lectin domain-containing protein [Spirochaetes bacterium]|nr:C-type lectin domain-containing protein [Spirochaetota bacterium]
MKNIFPIILLITPLLLTNCGRKPDAEFPCPGKSFTIGTHTYCAYREYVTWHEAKQRCGDAGGYLAVINSMEENEAIWELLGGTWEHSFWTGLNDRALEGSWQWASGETARYGNWRPGQPDNYHSQGEGEDCVEWLSEDGGWNDIICGDRRTYLCKSAHGRKKDFRCTGKLFSIGEYEYCAYRTWVDWQTARKSCEVNGGNLASIVSEEENIALFRELGSPWGYVGNLWIGFSDEAREGDFRWINGEPVRFGNWCTGEPSNAGKDGEDCAHMFTTRNCWNDSDCNTKFGFICERD